MATATAAVTDKETETAAAASGLCLTTPRSACVRGRGMGAQPTSYSTSVTKGRSTACHAAHAAAAAAAATAAADSVRRRERHSSRGAGISRDPPMIGPALPPPGRAPANGRQRRQLGRQVQPSVGGGSPSLRPFAQQQPPPFDLQVVSHAQPPPPLRRPRARPRREPGCGPGGVVAGG